MHDCVFPEVQRKESERPQSSNVEANSCWPYLFERLSDFDEYLTNSHIFHKEISAANLDKWKPNSPPVNKVDQPIVRPAFSLQALL
jgi:hypothetical protein